MHIRLALPQLGPFADPDHIATMDPRHRRPGKQGLVQALLWSSADGRPPS